MPSSMAAAYWLNTSKRYSKKASDEAFFMRYSNGDNVCQTPTANTATPAISTNASTPIKP